MVNRAMVQQKEGERDTEKDKCLFEENAKCKNAYDNVCIYYY